MQELNRNVCVSVEREQMKHVSRNNAATVYEMKTF